MAYCPDGCCVGNSAGAGVQLGDRGGTSRTVSYPSRTWVLTTTRGERLQRTALHGGEGCRRVPVRLGPGASGRHRPSVLCAGLGPPLLPHQHPTACVSHAGGPSEPVLDSPATSGPTDSGHPSKEVMVIFACRRTNHQSPPTKKSVGGGKKKEEKK